MRILFVMQYPGYLRYYDGVVRELADRGHRVLLAFDQPQKQPEGMQALAAGHENIEVLGKLPKRGDLWAPLARGLRGTLDYLKYLLPDYANSPYLRRRWEKFLPGWAAWLTGVDGLSPRLVRTASRAIRLLEQAIPADERFEGYLEAADADAVVVSPLITTFWQADLVKAAKRKRIPTAYGVASWDHLTTKGLVRVMPEVVLLWNEEQRSEAERLHYVDRERIEVTGAQNFDRWFEREPSTTREAFCEKVGLDPARPFVLFVGSTASISAPEAERAFVRRWLQALRDSGDAHVRELGVLVRPHPYNSAHWSLQDLADFDDATLWPRHGANPVDDDDRADYFDSMHHAEAVVGINTSAMIESAIVGRPVFAIRDPEFTDTQDGTVHFRYLLAENGGFVQTSASIAEHERQLAATLAEPDQATQAARDFVARFVRPGDLAQPRVPVVADVLERRLAKRAPASPTTLPLVALRALLAPFAVGTYLVERQPRIEKAVMARLPRPLRSPLQRRQKQREAARRQVKAAKAEMKAMRKAVEAEEIVPQ